ncbi:MAG: F0F1 ATP synthase subunit gamma [Betaproteobacteria bacterium]|nr:F0F1 ATP synthase subunit gamma [Betaproteobacteria bacterium]
MSKRLEIESQLAAFGEIADIMRAMRNLALMETHKVGAARVAQQRMAQTVEAAAVDFLSFYRQDGGDGNPSRAVYLVVGSERGFCGDFNEALVDRLRIACPPGHAADLVAVGFRLGSRLDDDRRVVARLAGPSVMEDVGGVLADVMEVLDRLARGLPSMGSLNLTVMHHADDGAVRAFMPMPFRQLPRANVPPAGPPMLTLSPAACLTGLMEHYLLASLYDVFYASLMAENLQRLRHMDNAIRNIEEQSAALALRRNSLRQEEITEEIEVIMLGRKPQRTGPER